MESGQRPGQQGDGDDQRQGQQNWTRTGGAGRGDRHRRRGELAKGRQDAAGESQTALGPMANTGECPKSLRWGHAEALSESWVFSALRLEPSLQWLLHSIIRLLAGWSFVRHCRTHAGL